MKDLNTTYLGIPIKNPLVIGSCGLTSKVKDIKKLANAGAAAIVLKSIFEEEIEQEYQEVLNSGLSADKSNLEFFDYYDCQLKEEALTNYTSLIKEAKKVVTIPIIASINCDSTGEWVSYAKKIQEAGADGIELNIFKLPFELGQEAESFEKMILEIVRKIREYVSLPIGIKMSSYFSNLGQVIRRVSQSNIQGLVLFNRFYNFDIDIDKDIIVNGEVYSSKGDYSMPLRWISVMSQKVDCDLVASTGVHDAETAIKMIMSGASSVELVSTLYKNGIDVIEEILSGIESWMIKRQFESITDFSGMLSQDNHENPGVFERVQFMKYFGGHSH